jgi:hypothetical protein
MIGWSLLANDEPDSKERRCRDVALEVHCPKWIFPIPCPIWEPAATREGTTKQTSIAARLR